MPHREGSWKLSHNRAKFLSQSTPKFTPLTYVVGASSDPGNRKKRNEDSIFAAWSTWQRQTLPLSFGLFVLADGMGAYANGQDASRGAIQAMVDYIWPTVLWPTILRSRPFQPKGYAALLTEAVQKANEAVHQQNIPLQARDEDCSVMTTVTAAMVVGSTAYVANVGDCRTYLYRAMTGLEKVTTDHLVVARLIEEGVLTPEELYTHPKRNQVYRALFTQPQAEADLFTVPLQPGDVVLLCSRSLWNVVRDPEIEDIIRSAPIAPSQVASVLIQTALDRSSWDNVSVIVVSMLEAQNQTFVPGVHLFAKPDSLHIPQV